MESFFFLINYQGLPGYMVSMATQLLDYVFCNSENVPFACYLECFVYLEYLENNISMLFSTKSCPNNIFT